MAHPRHPTPTPGTHQTEPQTFACCARELVEDVPQMHSHHWTSKLGSFCPAVRSLPHTTSPLPDSSNVSTDWLIHRGNQNKMATGPPCPLPCPPSHRALSTLCPHCLAPGSHPASGRHSAPQKTVESRLSGHWQQMGWPASPLLMGTEECVSVTAWCWAGGGQGAGWQKRGGHGGHPPALWSPRVRLIFTVSGTQEDSGG